MKKLDEIARAITTELPAKENVSYFPFEGGIREVDLMPEARTNSGYQPQLEKYRPERGG